MACFLFLESKESGIDRKGKKVSGVPAVAQKAREPGSTRSTNPVTRVSSRRCVLQGRKVDNSKTEGEGGRRRPEARRVVLEPGKVLEWLMLAGGGLDRHVSKKIQNATHSACSILALFGSVLLFVNSHKLDLRSRH